MLCVECWNDVNYPKVEPCYDYCYNYIIVVLFISYMYASIYLYSSRNVMTHSVLFVFGSCDDLEPCVHGSRWVGWLLWRTSCWRTPGQNALIGCDIGTWVSVLIAWCFEHVILHDFVPLLNLSSFVNLNSLVLSQKYF